MYNPTITPLKLHPRRIYKGKGTVRPTTEVEKYSSTLSWTSVLDGVGGQRHAPAAFTPRKTRYPEYGRLGGPQGRSRPQPGFDPPDLPAGSKSLHRMCYPGPRAEFI
jgi:hypothetical protein